MTVVTIDLLALVSVICAPRSARTKLVWCLLIIGLPMVGFVLWLAAGPRAIRRRR